MLRSCAHDDPWDKSSQLPGWLSSSRKSLVCHMNTLNIGYEQFSKNTLRRKSERDPKRKRGREIEKRIAVITVSRKYNNWIANLDFSPNLPLFVDGQFLKAPFHLSLSLDETLYSETRGALILSSQHSMLHCDDETRNLELSAPFDSSPRCALLEFCEKSNDEYRFTMKNGYDNEKDFLLLQNKASIVTVWVISEETRYNEVNLLLDGRANELDKRKRKKNKMKWLMANKDSCMLDERDSKRKETQAKKLLLKKFLFDLVSHLTEKDTVSYT
ncbi:hypothetical protein EAG_11793 [Camponotus floridanus]|uniref:Uncharacterized protein n=1 Tax=Camponotus floridanus TaxID=104421 RepID=E2AUP5_CAMFO|nr:hypothetical protein EAG_11793 [Camponotus floridanus]